MQIQPGATQPVLVKRKDEPNYTAATQMRLIPRLFVGSPLFMKDLLTYPARLLTKSSKCEALITGFQLCP